MSKTYGYGVTIPAPAGLDPERYVFTLGVHRRNGGALSEEEVRALAAALAPLATPVHETAGDLARVAALAAENEVKHEAMVAKVTGKAPSGKANGKRKSGGGKARKTVKPTKTATRKAARRSEG